MPIKIHLPNIPVTLMRPKPQMPPNEIRIRVPRWLNKIDIKNYMSAMYNLKIDKVSTYVQHRKRVQHPLAQEVATGPTAMPSMYKTMYKIAFLRLQGTFEFPPRNTGKTPNALIQERKQKKAAKAVEHRKLIFDRWDEVVKTRYTDKTEAKKIEIPESVELKDERPHALAEVKGSVLNRMKGKKIKQQVKRKR